jgi:hypothetical protein
MVKLENGLKPSALLRLYVSYLRHAIQIAVVAVARLTMERTHFKEKKWKYYLYVGLFLE